MTPAPNRRASHSDTRRRIIVAIPILLALLHVALALAAGARPVCDDAFIFVRYADNAVAGEGLVFNPGERVEGFTSPLWVALATALAWMGMGGVASLQSFGILAFAAASGMTARLADRLGAPPLLSMTAGCTVAASASLIRHALSGMETAAFALAIVGALGAVVREYQNGRVCGFGSGLWMTAATLVRPEGFGVAVVAWTVSWALLPAPDRRIKGSGLVLFGTAIGSLEAFRLAYYGAWLPNTFFAKVDVEPNLLAGLAYVGRGAFETPLLWLLVVTVIAAGRHWTRPTAIVGISVVALLGWVVWVGGDYVSYGRFLVPMIPAAAALAGTALGRRDRRTAIASLGLATALALLPQFLPNHVRRADQVVERGRVAARWMSANLPPDTLVATSAIGIVGAEGGTRILDLYGLVDPAIARSSDPDMHLGPPGHERGDPDLVLARKPDIILFGLNWVRPIPISVEALAANSDFLSLSEHRILASAVFQQEYRFFNTRVDRDRFFGMAIRRDSQGAPRAFSAPVATLPNRREENGAKKGQESRRKNHGTPPPFGLHPPHSSLSAPVQ